MKKIILIFLGVAIFSGIGVAGFIYFQKSSLEMEAILPEGPILYEKLSDVEKNLKELKESVIGQAIWSINYDLLMEKAGITSDQREFIKRIEEQISSDLTQTLAKKFFGRELGFAVYEPDFDPASMAIFLPNALGRAPSPSPEEIAGMLEAFLSNIVFVTRLAPDVQLIELITRFIDQFGEVLTQTKEYKGHTIHLVTIPDIELKIGLVRIKDLLVIGVGEKPIQRSIDVFEGEAMALDEDPQFRRSQEKFLAEAAWIGYLDMGRMFTVIEEQATDIMEQLPGNDERIAQFETQMEETFKVFSGFQTYGASYISGEPSQVNAHIFFNRDEMEPKIAAFYEKCLPVENKTIQFIPQDVLGYYWSSCLDFGYYWDQIKTELEKGDNAEDVLGTFESTIGLSVEEDIIPAFGNEIGGDLSDIEMTLLFPVPKFRLFVKVGDRSKMEALLGLLVNQPLFAFQEEEYLGNTIHYFSSPLGDALEPSYCFFDGYLLIAINRGLLRDSLKSADDPSLSLANSEDFKTLDPSLIDENVGVSFMHVEHFVQRIEEIVEWGNQWAHQEDRKREAFKAGSERRLADIQNEIVTKGKELEEMKGQIETFDAEIQGLETQGLPTSEKQLGLQSLKEAIVTIEQEMDLAREQTKELEKIVKGYDEHKVTPELRNLYLEEVINPLLKSFKSIKFFGGRTTISEDAFESDVFWHMTP